MKKFLLSIMLVMATMWVFGDTLGQETPSSLVMVLKSGTKENYELAKQPIITYSAASMTITSEGVEFTYPLNEVENFHFEAIEESGLTNVESDFTFRHSATNVFTVSGSKGAIVYNASGQQIKSFKESEQIIIDLNNQPVGIYIINIKGENKQQSIKIIKK